MCSSDLGRNGGVGTQPYSNAAVPATPMFLILANAMRGAVTITQPVLSVDWVRVFHN